jgi:hypothetical protein
MTAFAFSRVAGLFSNDIECQKRTLGVASEHWRRRPSGNQESRCRPGLGLRGCTDFQLAVQESQHKETEIRFANDLSYIDLKRSAAVFIGAFQNRWTLPELKEDGATNEDYVIVTRVPKSDSGQQ